MRINRFCLCSRRRLLFPVARMAPAPPLHAPNLIVSAEVVAVLRFSPPPTLAGDSAGVLATGLGTVTLVVSVPVVGTKDPPATKALTAHRLDAQAESKPEEKGGALGRNDAPKEPEKPKKEEGIVAEVPEENPSQEDQLLNRQIRQLRDRR